MQLKLRELIESQKIQTSLENPKESQRISENPKECPRIPRKVIGTIALKPLYVSFFISGAKGLGGVGRRELFLTRSVGLKKLLINNKTL